MREKKRRRREADLKAEAGGKVIWKGKNFVRQGSSICGQLEAIVFPINEARKMEIYFQTEACNQEKARKVCGRCAGSWKSRYGQLPTRRVR